ncbi:MAG TPA: hypothetical protein PKE54_03235, partial [Candidatus Obscuribacter sp.]|nr:hypothetical protein [Candidatus Obscuribacter sp.]
MPLDEDLIGSLYSEICLDEGASVRILKDNENSRFSKQLQNLKSLVEFRQFLSIDTLTDFVVQPGTHHHM